MAISIAQAVSHVNSSATTNTTTFGSATVNGNGIVVCFCCNSVPISVTDSAGNTYTQRRTNNFFGGQRSNIYDCVNISGNPTTVTVTITSAEVFPVRVYEVNGTLTAHAGNSNTGNIVNIGPGAITTSVANTIWFNCAVASASAQPSGWTWDYNGSPNDIASQVFTSTQTSLNPTWTNGSGGHTCVCEAYTSTNNGSVVYNKSVDSTLALTHTRAYTGVFLGSVASTLTLTETQVAASAHSPSVTSTLTLSQSNSLNTVLVRSVASTLTLTESQSTGYNLAQPVSSTLTFSQIVEPFANFTGSNTSTLTFTQDQETLNTLNKSVSQGLGIASIPTVETVLNLEVDETVSFTQHIAHAFTASVSHTLTLVSTAFPINTVINLTDASVVQKTPIASSGSNGGTLVLTFPGTTLNHDGIVVVVGNQGASGTTITSITDTGGNTYTLLQDASNLGSPRTRIYYCNSASPLTSITLHMSTTGNTLAAIAYEISGVITPDTGNTNTDNNTVQTPGAITTSASVLVFSADTGNNPTAPTGWVDDSQQQGVRFAHNIYSSVQTGLNPVFSAASRFAAAIESFTTANRGGVHSPLTLTQTVVGAITSNRTVPQTLLLTQPNRIPLSYILNRTVAQTLTLTETQTGVASKFVGSTLTFLEDQTFEVIKTATSILELTQSIDVEVVLNRTVTTIIPLFHVVSPGPNILNESVAQTLTLNEVAVGYNVKWVAHTLNLSQTVIGVASKSVKSQLAFVQAIHLNRSQNKSVASTLHLTEHETCHFSRAVSASSVLAFNSFQKARKVLTGSLTSTLVFVSEVARERHFESVSSVLTLTETMIAGHKVAPSILQQLHLNSVVALAKTTNVNVTNTLTFLRTHSRNLADLSFSLPNVQYLIQEPYTLIRGEDQVVVLPNPEFGDGLGNTGQFTVRFAINGSTYTYVKNNNTTKLNYNFRLSRSKCRELQRFLQVYQAKLVDLQNWKGEIWKVYITNNPFETTSISMYGPKLNEERWDISLEFEGIRMN